jgi:hypothetical protein
MSFVDIIRKVSGDVDCKAPLPLAQFTHPDESVCTRLRKCDKVEMLVKLLSHPVRYNCKSLPCA